MKFLLSIVLFLTTCLVPAFSQNKAYWVGAGFALSSSSTTLTADLNFQARDHLYFGLFGDVNVGNNNSINYPQTTSLGVGAGYFYKRQHLLLVASSGLTLDASFNRNIVSIGLPLKLQAYFAARRFGIGLNTIYKINSYNSYGGIGLVLGFGRMR